LIQDEVDAAGAGVHSPPVRALLAFQATRAREFFSRAVASLPKADARRFVAAEIMRAIYFDLLQRVERAGFDVFSSVIRVPRPRQARLAFGVWWSLR
jgi:phytoene synthase